MDKKEELKPCPHCGREAEITKRCRRVFIRCRNNNCRASTRGVTFGKNLNDYTVDNNGFRVYKERDYDKERMIKYWNRRFEEN